MMTFDHEVSEFLDAHDLTTLAEEGLLALIEKAREEGFIDGYYEGGIDADCCCDE